MEKACQPSGSALPGGGQPARKAFPVYQERKADKLFFPTQIFISFPAYQSVIK
jgi:hypothetical protein